MLGIGMRIRLGVAVLAEEDSTGGERHGEDAEESADGGAEVIGGKVGFGIDAVRERKGFAKIGGFAAKMRVVPAGDGDGVRLVG